MRAFCRLLGLGLFIAAVWPVLAQSGNQAVSFFTGANPRNIKYTPVDVGSANKAYNMNRSFHANRGGTTAVNTTNKFRGLSLGSWPPKLPTLSLLKGKANPYQPNPIKGKNPFEPAPKKDSK